MKKPIDLKVLIVGLGQIGGSIGLDLVEQGLVAQVTGYDKDPFVANRAVDQNVIHKAATSLEEEISRSDLVILAAPIREIIKLIPTVCNVIDDSSAILDMAGTKVEILEAVSKCGCAVNYIGGHPLAGSEKIGLDAAERQKFAGRTFVLTPSESVSKDWLDTVMHLISMLGAKPMIMSAEEHDRLIALTSHLPYALSLALMQMFAECKESNHNVGNLAAGSFKSATRVAGSSPELTLDMFLTNRDNITIVLDDIISHLSALKDIIQSGDEASLSELIRSVAKDHESSQQD
jgi:prephenate dehydrogenase